MNGVIDCLVCHPCSLSNSSVGGPLDPLVKPTLTCIMHMINVIQIIIRYNFFAPFFTCLILNPCTRIIPYALKKETSLQGVKNDGMITLMAFLHFILM